MIKKTKLVIIHYFGDEVRNIGKSPTGFPLQVQVRYKKIKTVFASRLGIKYANESVYNIDSLRFYPEISKEIITKEIKYIHLVRDYFEDQLQVSFDPRILINPVLENFFIESVENFFNSFFHKYYLEKIIRKYVSEADHICASTSTVRLLLFIKDLNPLLFEELISLFDYKEIFDSYILFREIEYGTVEEKMSKLSFRLMKTPEQQELKKIKQWFDKKFDEEILSYINKSLN
jgi:hypothetical protein